MLHFWTRSSCPKKNSCILFRKQEEIRGLIVTAVCSHVVLVTGGPPLILFSKNLLRNVHKGLLGSGRRAGVKLRGCSSTETWKVIYLALNIRKFFYLLVLKPTASKFLKIVVYFSKL